MTDHQTGSPAQPSTDAPTGHLDEATTPRRRPSTRALVVAGVLLSLLLAGVVSYYASSHPDGLMFVAGEKGFLGSEKGHAASDSPFAGYATHGVGNARLSGGLAGIVGVAVVGAIAFALFTVLRRRGHDQHGD